MVKCINYKSYAKGVTLGFADFFIEKWGINIYGCSLCMKNGHRWINFPSRSYTSPEGETKYMAYIRFENKSHKEKFEKVAIEDIERFCQEKSIDMGDYSKVVDEMNFTESKSTPF